MMAVEIYSLAAQEVKEHACCVMQFTHQIWDRGRHCYKVGFLVD
jgi:hypothetical protein